MFALKEFVPNEGEDVIYVARKHILYYFSKMFNAIVYSLFLIVSIVIYIIYRDKIEESFFTYGFPNYSDYIAVAFFVIMTIPIFYKYLRIRLDWYYDRLILTSTRLVYIDQHFIFSKDVQSINLKDINNVKSKIDGVMDSWLDLGILTVVIQDKEITFVGLANLGKVEQIINKARHNQSLIMDDHSHIHHNENVDEQE